MEEFGFLPMELGGISMSEWLEGGLFVVSFTILALAVILR